MKSVLFVCVHNSGRSQMAEAFLTHLSGGLITATSAGTVPGDRVNPVVIQAMNEKGLDMSENQPKLITQHMVDNAESVITMGCSIDETCPALFMPSEDWGLDDPQGKPLEAVREIRDQIENRILSLLSSQEWAI